MCTVPILSRGSIQSLDQEESENEATNGKIRVLGTPMCHSSYVKAEYVGRL
jgi:hypothetical protein